jgi:hypothetical protein
VPQSMTIGAFVLGAVLLLISLVRGGFKIFGAEISGSAGFLGRPIAFVIGITLIVTGFYFQYGSTTGNSPPLPSAAAAAAQDTPVALPQPVPKPSARVSPPADPPPEPVKRPAAAAEQAVGRLDVTWREATPELQQVLAGGLTQQQQSLLGLAVLTTGMDIYAVRVRLTNTGNVPVTISPESIRIHFGAENTAATTMEHPRFLHAGVVQPNRSMEGLLTFRARLDIGAAIRLGQGTVSYDDDSIQVTYNGK